MTVVKVPKIVFNSITYPALRYPKLITYNIQVLQWDKIPKWGSVLQVSYMLKPNK